MLFLILAIVVLILVAVVYQVVKLRRAVSRNVGDLPPQHADLLVDLTFDADSISAKYPDGGVIGMKWAELTNIGLASIDAPPDSPTLYWGLHSGKQIPTISYPHGAVGDKALLAEFAKRLPGFDMETVMKAVGTTGRAHFQIWPKK
jgi:hypothetical protein